MDIYGKYGLKFEFRGLVEQATVLITQFSDQSNINFQSRLLSIGQLYFSVYKLVTKPL